jgi:hypothetical protein
MLHHDRVECRTERQGAFGTAAFGGTPEQQTGRSKIAITQKVIAAFDQHFQFGIVKPPRPSVIGLCGGGLS